MIEFKYSEPKDLSQLFAILESDGTSAVLLAGGTDLVNHIRIGKKNPSRVIGLRNVKELSKEIEYRSDGIMIGALTTLTDLETHPIIREVYPSITEAANKVGSKQIRNRGTLVGNLCNASPAADTVPALIIYNAVVHIIGKQGRRSLTAETFITGPGKTDLKSGEIVEGIFLPNPPEHSSCYLKLARREGADLTTVGVAAFVSSDGEVRLGLGAVSAVPFRAYEAERMISSRLSDEADWENGLEAVMQQAKPISDLRGSVEYRLNMTKVYTKKALQLTKRRLLNKNQG